MSHDPQVLWRRYWLNRWSKSTKVTAVRPPCSHTVAVNLPSETTAAVRDYLRHIVVLNDRLLCVANEQLLVNESHQETHVRLWLEFAVHSKSRRRTGFPFPRGFTRSGRLWRRNVTFLGHPHAAVWHHDPRLRHHVELQELQHITDTPHYNSSLEYILSHITTCFTDQLATLSIH